MKTIVTALAIAASASAAIAPASAQTLPGGFVFLRDIDPTIIQDIRYAGSNNFVGRPLAGYDAAECVVKRRRRIGAEKHPARARATESCR